MIWPRFLTIPRPPDFIIWQGDDLYLERWNIIPRNKWFGLYLHHFIVSDDARAFHDHQYDNISLLLWGSYLEITPHGSFKRYPFWPVFRRAADQHRVDLINKAPVWSLFFMGPRYREWGFQCPQGWVHWTKFVEQLPGGNRAGTGCE